MEIYYQISWRRSRSGYACNANGYFINSGSSLECQYSCSDTILSTMSYVCSYFSAEDDWSFGEYHIAHTFDSLVDETTVTIGTLGSIWASEASGKSNISTTFSLVMRADTGKINSSPQILPTPPLRLQQGCNYTIPLAINDPDNDTVRCRWAVGIECESICNKLPGASLETNSCTITYNANYGIGLKAVAIVIEDYAPGSSNHPLSSVTLLFLVLVYYSSQPCSTQAEYFRLPSIVLHPSNETVILRSYNESVNLTLTCIANETSSYYWERQNGDIPLTSIDIWTNTLNLIDVQLHDAGNYRCVAFVCSVCRRSFSNYATVTITVNGKMLCCLIRSYYGFYICI